MTTREFDPLHLDVAAFAKAEATLAGAWPLADLVRLHDSAMPGAADAGAPPEVAWQARGERRALRGGEHQVWLHLSASVSLALECQRCLRAVAVPLKAQRSFLFVQGEAAAAQLDAETEDDVLALTRALDLRELIEDELLLSQPLVPRHEECPVPLRLGDDADEPEETDKAPHPFAALARLRRKDPLN
jgi:uncharacterized protein